MYSDFDVASLESDLEDPTGGGAAMDFEDWPETSASGMKGTASATKPGERDPLDVIEVHEESTSDDGVVGEVRKTLLHFVAGPVVNCKNCFSRILHFTFPARCQVVNTHL